MRKERDKCSKMGNGGMIATRWGERAEGGTSTGQSTSPKPLWYCSPPDHIWPLLLLRLWAPGEPRKVLTGVVGP